MSKDHLEEITQKIEDSLGDQAKVRRLILFREVYLRHREFAICHGDPDVNEQVKATLSKEACRIFGGRVQPKDIFVHKLQNKELKAKNVVAVDLWREKDFIKRKVKYKKLPIVPMRDSLWTLQVELKKTLKEKKRIETELSQMHYDELLSIEQRGEMKAKEKKGKKRKKKGPSGRKNSLKNDKTGDSTSMLKNMEERIRKMEMELKEYRKREDRMIHEMKKSREQAIQFNNISQLSRERVIKLENLLKQSQIEGEILKRKVNDLRLDLTESHDVCDILRRNARNFDPNIGTDERVVTGIIPLETELVKGIVGVKKPMHGSIKGEINIDINTAQLFHQAEEELLEEYGSYIEEDIERSIAMEALQKELQRERFEHESNYIMYPPMGPAMVDLSFLPDDAFDGVDNFPVVPKKKKKKETK